MVALRVRINRRGDLVLSAEGGAITLKKPISYQHLNGKKRIIRSGYVLTGRNEIGFRVGRYHKNFPLVIDPVLSYSTYLGGSSDEQGNGIAVDSSGNAYIVGKPARRHFLWPVRFKVLRGTASDAFVTKLNSTGSALVYSTYLGGKGSDVGNAIAVDSSGNAYVTGQTASSNFPLMNAIHGTFSGISDAFVAKLSASGSGLVFSTFLGGHSADIGHGIAVDNSGNAVVTGSTGSTDFPNSESNSKQQSRKCLIQNH